MEMFLMVATVSVVGMLITFVLFAASMREDRPVPAVRPEASLPLAPPGFFLTERTASGPTRVPIEVLLMQNERHVRLEQAAAESFLDAPTIKSLHSRTTSPLVH